MSAQMTDQSGDENFEQETDDTAKKPDAGSDLQSLTTKNDACNNGASDNTPTVPKNKQQDSIHQSVTFKEQDEKCTNRDVTVVEFSEKDQDYVNSTSLSHNRTLDITQVTANDLEETRSTPAEERPLVSPILQHISDRAPVAGTGAEMQDQRLVEDKDELILLLKYKMPPGEKLVIRTEKFSCSKDFLKYWNFFTRTNKGKKMLEVIVRKDKCSVKVSNDDVGLFIFEVSDKIFEQESDVKGFADRVLRSVNECAQKSLSLGCFKVDFAMQDDILQVAKNCRELDSAWIEVDVEHDPETIFGVCTVGDKESMFGLIARVIAEAKTSFENHVEKVTVDAIWQTVLKSFGYLKEMEVNFPRTKIKPDGTIFQLEGPKEETKVAAVHVKELLQKARKEVIQEIFSPGFQFEIFLHQEMHDYITESIQNFPVVWIPNSETRKIHVFSRKHESLKGVDKCIKGCIREQQYLWPKHQCIQSHKIKLLENLKEKHKGKIVIQSLDTGLLVTTSDDIYADVDSEVQNIIRMRQTSIDQSVSEKPDNKYEQPVRWVEPIETNDVPMKNDNTKSKQITKTVEVKEKRLFKLLMEDIPYLSEMAKTLGVCICEVEKTNKVGFKLKGLDKPVQDMFECLTQKVKMEEKKMKDCDDLTGATKIVHAERELTNADVQSESNRMYANTQLQEKCKSKPHVSQNISPGGTWEPNQDKDLLHSAPGDTLFKQNLQIRLPGQPLFTACSSVHGQGPPPNMPYPNHPHLPRPMVPCHWTQENDGPNIMDTNLQQQQHQLLQSPGPQGPSQQGMQVPPRMPGQNQMQGPSQQGMQVPPRMPGQNQMQGPSQQGMQVPPRMPGQNQMQESYIKRIRVKVEKGFLHEAQTDVLVNTVARSLNLRIGNVSSSLLSEAGQGIQNELNQRGQCKEVKFGEVLITGRGNLANPCKAIYHGALQFFTVADSVKVLEDFILSCLKHANEKYKSIAFPAIGTGKLGFPKETVASLMFQCVMNFEKSHPQTRLEEVKFMIHEEEKETFLIFEQMHRSYIGSLKDDVTEPPQMDSSYLTENNPMVIINKIKNKDPSTPAAASSRMESETQEPAFPEITIAARSGEQDIRGHKALTLGKERYKSSLQHSQEEQDCFFVCDVNQEEVESLRRCIKSSSTTKCVYPYKPGIAFVICTDPREKDTLMSKLKEHKLQSLDPQIIQDLTAVVDPVIWRRATEMKKDNDLKDMLNQDSGVNISVFGSSVQFKAMTSHQLKIAQNCLIRFTEETLGIKVQETAPGSSSIVEVEKSRQIEDVTKNDFLALQSLKIYSKWTKEFRIRFSHSNDILYVHGSCSCLNETTQKEIEAEIVALRGKQKVEITYDPHKKEQFRSAIENAKSDKLLLVWDDDNKQVLVYSDGFEEIKTFKHKVEFKMGKMKLTGRRGDRFVSQENTNPLCFEDDPTVKKKTAQAFSWSQDASNVEVFKTLEGIVVKVYEADILRLGVDCIVNAANDNLQHGGGVALVIAKGAGPEVDREGSKILKSRGRINVGEQCVTTAGNLPYNCIIHTVGPKWSDYYPHDTRNTTRCEKDLFLSIIGCFNEADKYQLKSIAFPAISSGIFAVPRNICTEQYAKAVIHYSKTRTGQGLEEIHFIDKLPDIVKDIQLAFKRHIGVGTARHSGGDQAVSAHTESDNICNQHDYKPQKYSGTPTSDEGQSEDVQDPAEPILPEFELKMSNKQKCYHYRPNKQIEVKIYTSDITKLRGIEAIACSVDRKGNELGTVASRLSQMDELKYTSSKKKAFKKETHLGEVIVTRGGQTNFQIVAHAVMPSSTDKIKPKEHQDLVRKSYGGVLQEVNTLSKSSLALHLIGTGYAELDHEGSAELFLDSLKVFCNSTTNWNLHIIHIIIKDERTIEKVADMFRKYTEKIRRQLLATHGKNSGPTSIRIQEDSMSQVNLKRPVSGAHSKQKCSICLDEVKSPKTLSCGQYFQIKPVCPKCEAEQRIIYGDQPKNGQMTVTTEKFSLDGYKSRGTLKIKYQIPFGQQEPDHPNPNKRYKSINKTAYLPDTEEGRKVCDLLKVAFERRLIFTFARSTIRDVEDFLIWSDISHKTELRGKNGYPDPTYLQRVQKDLAAKGITAACLVQESSV